MTCHCKRCGKSWDSLVEKPKKCRHCASPFWNTDKVRGVAIDVVKGAAPSKQPVVSRDVTTRAVTAEEAGADGKLVAGDAFTVAMSPATVGEVHPDYVADVLFGGIGVKLEKQLLETMTAHNKILEGSGETKAEVFETTPFVGETPSVTLELKEVLDVKNVGSRDLLPWEMPSKPEGIAERLDAIDDILAEADDGKTPLELRNERLARKSYGRPKVAVAKDGEFPPDDFGEGPKVEDFNQVPRGRGKK